MLPDPPGVRSVEFGDEVGDRRHQPISRRAEAVSGLEVAGRRSDPGETIEGEDLDRRVP